VSEISSREYKSLAEFRYQIRRFVHFSETAAKQAGVEPRQHQLLLAVKAKEPEPAGIGYLAERLQLRHNSAVELVDRMERSGLARRVRRPTDRRSADVALTNKGAKILRELSLHHRKELRTAVPGLIESLLEIQEGSSRKEEKMSACRS
jgi:DNA-binding MarR family transcriptional regulator